MFCWIIISVRDPLLCHVDLIVSVEEVCHHWTEHNTGGLAETLVRVGSKLKLGTNENSAQLFGASPERRLAGLPAVDHPRYPESIDKHAKTGGPESLL